MLKAGFACSIALVLNVACNSLELDWSSYVPASPEEAPSEYVPYEEFWVEVPDSSRCIVYYKGTQIAVCNKSGYVMVPKQQVATKAANDDVTIYTVGAPAENGIDSENTLEMIVAFEDTKDGDHDYNDLIFQAIVNIVNKADGTNSTKVDITPIALGGEKNISLGVLLTEEIGDSRRVLLDQTIFTNCRESMFNGDADFINTYSSKSPVQYETITKELETTEAGAVTGISWFIQAAGSERLYAANSFQPCLDNEKKLQGLVLTNLRSGDDLFTYTKDENDYQVGGSFWYYPQESTPIEQLYPEFDGTFRSGSSFTVLATPETNSDYYDPIMANGKEISDTACLYTIYFESESGAAGAAGVADAIQLWDNGPKWATWNLGASKPEEIGQYFAWASIIGFNEVDDNEKFIDGSFPMRPYYTSYEAGKFDAVSLAGNPLYDASTAMWGDGWRMPTRTEYFQLTSNTTCEWTSNYNDTGVAGMIFTGKGSYQNKSIFIPAGGMGKDVNREKFGIIADLWLADCPTPENTSAFVSGAKWGITSYNAWSISLQNNPSAANKGAGGGSVQRSFGMNIRPIHD